MNGAESIDLLFAEPFEPLWMKRQREAEADEIQTEANDKWRRAADLSRQRIAARCDGSKYHNPPDTRIVV
jgi:hypothetical protein